MATAQLTLIDVSIKNILVATDFWPHSKAAFWFAASLAKRYDAILHTAHILAPDGPALGYVGDDVDRYYREQRQSATQEMDKLQESATMFGIHHHEIIREGEIAETLDKIARAIDIDLAVLGTGGAKGINKVLMGSVAEQILRRIRVPVLTIGPGVGAFAGEVPITLSEVLYPTDFSPESLGALPYAISVAKANMAQLTLLYVDSHAAITSFADAAVLRTEYGRELAKLLPPNLDLWNKPLVRVEFGEPAEVILQTAIDGRANLIVLGVRYEREFADHLPWSVASKVIRESHCPVLTVRGTRS